MSWASETYGWNLDYTVWTLPLLTLLLLMRQHIFAESNGTAQWTLEDKEMIDNLEKK